MTSYEESQRLHAEWLASLKPKDRAAIPARWSDGCQVLTVERVTATQIVMEGGERFRRGDGRSFTGDSWNRAWLKPITPELLEANEKSRLRAWLEAVNVRKKTLSLETMRAMKAAFDATHQEAA